MSSSSGRSQRIHEDDVRAMLRLMGEIADLPRDTERRVRHALGGIAGLIGADFCFSTRVRSDPAKNDVEPYAVVTHGMTDAQLANTIQVGHTDPFHWFVVQGMHDPPRLGGAVIGGAGREWPYTLVTERLDADRAHARREAADAMQRNCGGDMEVAILHPTGAPFHYASLGVLRTTGQRRRMGPREIQIARLMWQSLDFLHRAPLAAVDERLWGTELPPRLAQVLDDLRQGMAAKQIARHLSLSQHTINEYTQEIYRRFGVSGRAELLALFAKQARADV